MFARHATLRRVIAAALLLAVGGCAQWRLPRIDPSGERIFLPQQASAPAAPQVNPNLPLLGNVDAAPVLSAPTPLAASPSGLNTGLGCIDNCPVANWLNDEIHSGCDWLHGDSPTVSPPGMPVTAARPVRERLVMTPQRVLAPVGSEVILKAGVCGKDQYLYTNRRIEWMLGREGVGQLVTIGERGEMDFMRLPWQRPDKVDNFFAVGYTSPFHTCINRGTADTTDDVQVRPGDAWITVSSASEGTSFVTAYAPESADWETRRDTAVIYWIDAQWQMPPSANVQLGQPHTLTTVITRQSDGAPVEGYLVRYEVTDGSRAALGYDAGQTSEVRTDSQGRASVEVTPTDDGAGSSQVTITVVRPARSGEMASPRLEVGQGQATITWSPTGSPGATAPPATFPPSLPPTQPPTTNPPGGGTRPPDPFEPPTPPAAGRPELDVRIERKSLAPVRVNEKVAFVVTVVNNGDAPARDIVLYDRFDRGLQHDQDPTGRKEIKYLGMPDIGAGESDQVTLEFGVTAVGQQCHAVTVEAVGAEDGFARACIQVEPPAAPPQAELTIPVDGELQRDVGQEYNFRARVVNNSQVAAVNVEVEMQLDPTLEPLEAEVGYTRTGGGFRWVIPRLEPNQSKPFGLRCRCIAPSDSSGVKVYVRAANSPEYAEASTVEILPRTSIDPAPPAPGPTAPPTGLGAVLYSPTNPTQVSSRGSLNVAVTNHSATPMTNVEFRLVFPQQIRPQLTAQQTQLPFRTVGNTLEFQPITELRAGETVRVIVPFDPVAQGNAQVIIEARSNESPAGVSVSETISILSR
ncbi:Large cysteine-rich periplasmic protein OmcB [Pseudobythopirellula maris]|uniref:Large cysteine-rich periplasmic protein OmcB n=1 Tax=Pseudobythopirellula maris TaxID=2527991 RepID=A0A5C5ZUP8_9BACT|nr:DUF11 domain-containing protein [Pseudobythopirellula maris]TWT90778.1 Large cysteine-rich periplasmic protein OmcB [Pseudobythopirellula maris]